MNEKDDQWEPIPSYGAFFLRMADYVQFTLKEPSKLTGASYWNLFLENNIGLSGLALIITSTVVLTFVKRRFTKHVIRPIGRQYQLTNSSKAKLPDSVWSLIFYSLSWLWTFYFAVVVSRSYQNPSALVTSWDPKVAVPWNIKVLYTLQASYYLQCLYAMLFVDVWKKDYGVLVCHHILTLCLLSLSWLPKYTEFGSLLLLFHDCCDVILELVKISTYFKVQKGKIIQKVDALSTVFFVMLLIAWFVARLYLYPLKMIHVIPLAKTLDVYPQLYMVNIIYTMTIILLFLNIYWFALIVGLAIRVITGRNAKLDYPRDEDDLSEGESGYKSD